jgi:hypothetical protein
MNLPSEPKLPFEPEERERLLARFANALTPVVDSNRPPAPGELPLCEDRRHVFDFPEGIRMIASVDRDHDVKCLHLSFGLHPTCTQIASVDALVRVAHQWAAVFVGLEKPIHSTLTHRAFHLFYER